MPRLELVDYGSSANPAVSAGNKCAPTFRSMPVHLSGVFAAKRGPIAVCPMQKSSLRRRALRLVAAPNAQCRLLNRPPKRKCQRPNVDQCLAVH